MLSLTHASYRSRELDTVTSVVARCPEDAWRSVGVDVPISATAIEPLIVCTIIRKSSPYLNPTAVPFPIPRIKVTRMWIQAMRLRFSG